MSANNGNNPFSFDPPDTKTISASAVSASATWTGDATNSALRVYNSASVIAFLRLGDGAQVATLADLPIAPGAVEVIGGRFNTVAVILPSGTGTVYVTKGSGM